METDLPVTIGLWLAALLPIGVLLLLLWRRWPTAAAAPAALAAAVAMALLFFRTPLRTLAVAAGKGIWDALFILYVVWPALLLYHVGERAEAFAAIQRGLRRLIPDRLLAVLALAWVFGSFIQSIAGFGTPLAVTPPLLVGLGVEPVYAVLLPLIGRAWGNMFGTLGVTWFATQTVVDLAEPGRTLVYTAILLWIPELLGGLGVAWIYGRWWALRRAWPAIGVLSLLHGGLQLALVPFVPAVANLIAAAAALGAVLLLGRWQRYRQFDPDEPGRVFRPEAQEPRREEGVRETPRVPEVGDRRPLSFVLALTPYALLAGLALIALLIPPLRALLERFEVGLPFPAAETGYGVTREAAAAYSAFAPLTHPGTFVLLAALIGYVLYRLRGAYTEQVTLGGIVADAARDALPATTAITALLLLSKVMDHSGEITVLALGVATVAPPLILLAVSNWIGILGALITSSNTASNVLFAPLQATAAEAAGLPVALMVAAQSAGGATGNAVAPSEILMGAAVVEAPDETGTILRHSLPWTAVAGVALSVGTLVIYGWLQ